MSSFSHTHARTGLISRKMRLANSAGIPMNANHQVSAPRKATKTIRAMAGRNSRFTKANTFAAISNCFTLDDFLDALQMVRRDATAHPFG